jgi:uncharacterized protein YbgA (DUF1722 family)
LLFKLKVNGFGKSKSLSFHPKNKLALLQHIVAQSGKLSEVIETI